MFRHFIAYISLIFIFSATAEAAQFAKLPKHIQTHYVVTKDGLAFANVHEDYVVTGNSYKVESITKGIGVYALLGVRKLTSTGKVTSLGLKPMHFKLHQGNNPNKALFTDFDWTNNTLRMKVKGESREAKLSAGTQDLASYAYQFMFLPRPLKEDITIRLTTGKKLNEYQYKNSEVKGSLTVAGTAYKTVHLVPKILAKDQIETKELWLAVDQHYLLLRFLMVDEHGAKLEQTLTELHVD